MMDGIANLGGTRQFTVEDYFVNSKFETQSYTFKSIMLDGFAEREQYILGLKPNPLLIIAALPNSLDADKRSEIARLAMEEFSKPQFVDEETETKFLDSTKGIAFRLWQSLRDNHEELGMVVDGKPAKYKINGQQYTLTPSAGINAALAFLDRQIRYRIQLAKNHNASAAQFREERLANDDTEYAEHEFDVSEQDYVDQMMIRLRTILDATEEKDIVGN